MIIAIAIILTVISAMLFLLWRQKSRIKNYIDDDILELGSWVVADHNGFILPMRQEEAYQWNTMNAKEKKVTASQLKTLLRKKKIFVTYYHGDPLQPRLISPMEAHSMGLWNIRTGKLHDDYAEILEEYLTRDKNQTDVRRDKIKNLRPQTD